MISFDFPSQLCSVNQKYISRTFTLSTKYKQAKKDLGEFANLHRKGVYFATEQLLVKLAIRYPRKGTDIDSSVKFILDALSGVCYDDDSQIFTLLITKEYVGKKNAGVQIDIAPIK